MKMFDATAHVEGIAYQVEQRPDKNEYLDISTQNESLMLWFAYAEGNSYTVSCVPITPELWTCGLWINAADPTEPYATYLVDLNEEAAYWEDTPYGDVRRYVDHVLYRRANLIAAALEEN